MVNSETIYIALGSNLGDRKANLDKAIDNLPPKVQVLAQSPIYQTAPWGYEDQPDYLNQVIKCETTLSPEDLWSYVNELENMLGRRPTFRYGPRLIDIDILFYGDLVMYSPDLIIPHPRLQERSFVLAPLADLVPKLRHPVSGKTVEEMLEEVGHEGVSRLDEP
jgi:2-amino-4-hydroxy-6-hydroxymethyldihydropteridine diphosphokinase